MRSAPRQLHPSFIPAPKIKAVRDVARYRKKLVGARTECLDREIELLTTLAGDRLHRHSGYVAIQAISGVGPVLAAVFVAEIGEVTRFGRTAQLASWAGLTPKHHESDTSIHRGRITKMGCGGRGRVLPVRSA